MRLPLIVKLLAINVAVIAVVLLSGWLAVDYLAAGYFSALMEQYNISPTATHAMFVESVHRYLIGASIIATLVAITLSYLLIRRVLRPLRETIHAAERLAAGDYGARAAGMTDDEIGRVTVAFNRMADSVQRMDELRRNMVVDVAHELRTPLTNIRGYLEALQDGVVPATKETFALLHDEAIRLAHLADDLQRLARADAARAHLSRTEINVRDLFGQVAALYRTQVEEKRIEVRIRAEADVTARADREKLLQVLSNLFQNACQYTPDAGSITLAAGRTTEGIEIRATNTSDAFPEQVLPLLFERFYRADKSRSRSSGGAGIGLAIVKQLVEAHGGTVMAENTPAGLCIRFTLPG